MRQAMSPQWPWGQWAELGRGRGEGLARPQGFKAEQGEGLHSPGLGQPLAQLEGGTVAKGRVEDRRGRELLEGTLSPWSWTSHSRALWLVTGGMG